MQGGRAFITAASEEGPSGQSAPARLDNVEKDWKISSKRRVQGSQPVISFL